jgi:hypothetical protein
MIGKRTDTDLYWNFLVQRLAILLLVFRATSGLPIQSIGDLIPLKLIPLLKPYDAQEMEEYKVSSQVNSVKNNNPDLIKAISNKLNKLL